MAKLLYTVDDLISQVRSQLDEDNTDSVSTDEDILPALNRAQDYAMDILARKYPEPLLKHVSVTLTGGTAEYDIPEDAFEDRLLKVEVDTGNQNLDEVSRISYSDITIYESDVTTAVPDHYCIVGRKYRLVPTPNGAFPLRIWYLRNPEKLVQQQGRIVVVNTGSNYVTVEDLGELLTSETDDLNSYFNVVDGQTGEIKGSFQVQSILDSRITIRTSPARSSVLNRTISSSLSGLGIAVDDYVCQVTGTCVPTLVQPTSNFLVKYTVAEVTGQLGGDQEAEDRLLAKFEKQLEKTWVGRELDLRIKKRSAVWGSLRRRRFLSTSVS